MLPVTHKFLLNDNEILSVKILNHVCLIVSLNFFHMFFPHFIESCQLTHVKHDYIEKVCINNSLSIVFILCGDG